MEATLIDSMGSDLTVVNAARVSMDAETSVLDGSDVRLINFLARGMTSGEYQEMLTAVEEAAQAGDRQALASLMERYRRTPTHWTPFSHVMLQFRMKMPIFIARQWFRHFTGLTRNEVSRRYVCNPPEMWRPEAWRKAPEGSVKQGSGGPMDDQRTADSMYRDAVNEAEKAYRNLLGYGASPEQARAALPQGMYTTFIETGSLFAYARICSQRLDDHAQREIRDLAEWVSDAAGAVAPHSWNALMGHHNGSV